MNELISEINVLFYCTNHLCEVPFDNVVVAECAVEELASMALHTLFEHVLVDNVSITLPSLLARADASITISIRAQGYSPLPLMDSLPLDCAIEDRLVCALLEFFGTLDVECCAVV